MVFVGGAAAGLLITDAASRDLRVTNDVDIVIEITNRAAFDRVERQLFRLGFRNVEDGPVCRYSNGKTVLDVMTTEDIFGFYNPWYPLAVATAIGYSLLDGRQIRLIDPACFLATKLEAFKSPSRENHGDFLASHDFEDIVSVIDGRSPIADDVLAAPEEVKRFIAEEFRIMLERAVMMDAIFCHLPTDEASQKRIVLILERIKTIVDLTN